MRCKMAKSKLGIGTIDINKKFKSKEDAMKYAKRLQQYIKDMCKRKGWQVSAMIGISRLRKQVSTINYEVNGKRGRPKKKVMLNEVMANGWYKGNYLVDWHLHIILVSKPSYAARNEIKRYIDKNWKDIEKEHEVKEFDLEDLDKKEVYKKKCNIKMTEYFIRQSEEVKFCHYNYSDEEDLKYSLKEYYYEYLKVHSAMIRLIRKHKNNPMGEEEYLMCLDKINDRLLDIEEYFLELSKKDDDKRKEDYLMQVRFDKIAENYNKGQKNYRLRRRIMEEDTWF